MRELGGFILIVLSIVAGYFAIVTFQAGYELYSDSTTLLQYRFGSDILESAGFWGFASIALFLAGVWTIGSAQLRSEREDREQKLMRIKQEEEEESQRKARRARPARKPQVVRKTKPVEEIADSLDLKGVACPFNYVHAKIRLETMQLGQLLEITIDDGEPIENVPKSLTNDGHEVIDTKKVGQHYRLTIRKGE